MRLSQLTLDRERLRKLYELQNDVTQTALEVVEGLKSQINSETYRMIVDELKRIKEENEKSFHEDLRRIRCYETTIYL